LNCPAGIKRLARIAIAVAMAVPATAAAQAAGDSADVLPKGLFKADVHYVYTTTGTLSRQGALPEENAGEQVALLRELVGASSDFGNANIAYRGSAQVLAPALFYGVHSRITVGMVLPIFLSARVDINDLNVGTGAIGYNPDFASDPVRQSPILSASDPRALRGEEGINRLLTDAFQYQPVESWSNKGLGDLQAYARANVLKSRYAKAAVQTGVTFPTGEADAIDNLVDFGLGGGNLDVGALALFDVVPTKSFGFNLRAGYTVQLPNKQNARVFENASIPLAPAEELPDDLAMLGQEREVVRDLGDVFQAGTTLRAKLGIWMVSGNYDFFSKGADSYHSRAGDHPAMSANTAYNIHKVGGAVGVDFVQKFLKGKAPLPIMFDVNVSQAFSKNDPSNMFTVMSRLTLFFGSADAAKNASKE
jgi:hypothetical protein